MKIQWNFFSFFKLKRIILVLGFLVTIIGSFLTVFYISKNLSGIGDDREGEKLIPKVKIILVKKEYIRKKYRYYGSVVFAKKFEIFPKLKERIRKVYVEKGDSVKKGQLIVKLNDEELLLEMDKARNELEKKKIELKIGEENLIQIEREIKKRIRSILVLEKEKESKELEIENMLKILSNKNELVKVGGFSEESYRQLENQYQQLIVSYEKVKKELESSKIGFDLKDIPDNLKSNFKGNLIENENLFIELHTRSERLQLEKLKKELEAYEISYKQLEMQYKNTFIYAPDNGEVADKYFFDGEIAFPDKPLLLIIDKSKTFIEFSVPERELDSIKVGSKLKILIGEKEYDSFVDRIYPLIDEKTRMATLRCEIKSKNNNLLPGMFAIIDFFSVKEKEVFKVPIDALMDRKENEAKIYVVNQNDYIVGRWITIDSVDEEYAYIISGIENNEKVVISNPAQLKEGTRVMIQKEK